MNERLSSFRRKSRAYASRGREREREREGEGERERERKQKRDSLTEQGGNCGEISTSEVTHGSRRVRSCTIKLRKYNLFSHCVIRLRDVEMKHHKIGIQDF
jgi:hypothetical protein